MVAEVGRYWHHCQWSDIIKNPFPPAARGGRLGWGVLPQEPPILAFPRTSWGEGTYSGELIMSMASRIFTLFFPIFFFQTNAFANTTDADSLSQLLKNIQTMQASFNQSIVDKKAKQIQHSSGLMSLQRPGKFRWEVKKPVAQIIVTNGAKVWIYDPDLEQVTIRALTKEVGQSPAMLLTDANLALEKNYDVTKDANASSLSWFSLTPKNKNSVFATIRLGFNNDQIREMILQDQLGHTTSIEFYNIKLNPMLSAKLFAFQIPRHVDVIDETRNHH
jgi:outer membrane lipoprotein carrier protein